MKKIVLPLFIIVIFACCSKLEHVGDSNSTEPNLKDRMDIIFFGGFEEEYNNEVWKEKWGIEYIERGDQSSIVEKGLDNTKSLRLEYPVGGIGPKETGTSFPIVFKNIKQISEPYYKELYLRYYVKFEKGFDFRLGGKLPGLIGGGDSWTQSGGQQPDGTNGWTLRFMWRNEGKIVVYAYLPKSGNGKYGGHTWGQDIDCNFAAIPGEWHCIEEYVNVGTPGKDNGKLKVWIEGIERLDLADIRFWDVENNYGYIGGIYFSTFHGGNTPEWAPRIDSYAQFDGFVVAKNRVGLID